MVAEANEILVVDDEPALREILTITLQRQGHKVVTCPDLRSAQNKIETRDQPFPLIITDLVMPDGSGMDVLAAAQEKSTSTQVIVITAYSTIESAIDAMRRGAYDFVRKPFSPAEIAALAAKALEKNSIVSENTRLKKHLASTRPTLEDEFGGANAMRKVATLLVKAASTRSTVLITGESGTGKERVARQLHQLSDRADQAFCVINCGALPEALMESELFGHEKGAFTGAGTASPGMFRQAHRGTLLLDEIGELPYSLQVKLLRVLQERKVRPVGSSTEVDIDVRVLAATNRDVESDVADGSLRKDLYYRLNVIRIELPPLRERDGEIRRLAQMFMARFAKDMNKSVMRLTPEALEALESYEYPGNIRELENMIERAVALTANDYIQLEDLPSVVCSERISVMPSLSELPEEGCEIDKRLDQLEKQLLMDALNRTQGKRTAAAKLLGISFRSMRYRLAKHNMDEADDPQSLEKPFD